ncbi:MAG: hypothetical protein M3O61_06990 [Gemmatimonadota bacterium]|nr:hypothetical protein [Gemmatimonadota bacterium]
MIVLGVTGHRILAEPAKIRAGVRRGLHRISNAFPDHALTVLSALAEGADRLIAKEVLASPGALLVVVLPIAQEDYVTDFVSAASRAEFLKLIERAHQVIELPPQPSRNAGYQSAGDYVVSHCDVLMTVWDGRDAQGQGGTGATVALARRKQIPIVWVKAGNRKPGTMTPTSLGVAQGEVSFENLGGGR